MFRVNYLQSQSDVQKLVAGIKLIRQVFQEIAFNQFRGKEIAPGADVQSDAALELISEKLAALCGILLALAKWVLTPWRL
jgi:choline dehydrogenase-like flavoprotein